MAAFPATSVIHVKRKRDDAPIDSLYLESASKRARSSTLTPKVYFKRLAAPHPASSNTAPVASTATPPLLPASHTTSAASTGDHFIRGPDGAPAILSSPEGEEERDPLALRQRARVVREQALASTKRHVVIQRAQGGGGSGGGGLGAGGGGAERTFAIAKGGGGDGGEPMEVDGANGGEFVYDVFVKESVQATNGVASGEGGAGTVREGVSGTLVVGDEDEEWLESYFWDGVEKEDEDRVYTDDEDSNAEDYYGADYPEDEDDDSDDSDDDDDDDDYEREEEEYVADYDDNFQAMSYR